MLLTLYTNKSDDNTVGKVLEKGVDISFNFKTRVVDTLNPVLLLGRGEGKPDYDIYNYAYIDGLKRFYFIDEVEIVSSKIARLHLRVDVLETYKDVIKKTKGVIKVPCRDGLFGEISLQTTGRESVEKIMSDVSLKPANTILMTTVGR